MTAESKNILTTIINVGTFDTPILKMVIYQIRYATKYVSKVTIQILSKQRYMLIPVNATFFPTAETSLLPVYGNLLGGDTIMHSPREGEQRHIEYFHKNCSNTTKLLNIQYIEQDSFNILL